MREAPFVCQLFEILVCGDDDSPFLNRPLQNQLVLQSGMSRADKDNVMPLDSQFFGNSVAPTGINEETHQEALGSINSISSPATSFFA